jgi:hypothetical protein
MPETKYVMDALSRLSQDVNSRRPVSAQGAQFDQSVFPGLPAGSKTV